jgi:hypothetical protein
MRRRQRTPARIAASFLFAIILSACSRTGKPDDSQKDFAAALARAAMYKPPSTGEPPGKVILPNPKLIGCSTSGCPPVLPDGTDPRVVYPWQVSLDYTNGSVIGLVALYDEPTSINDVQAAVNERYGQWALANFRTGPARLWRVEPEHLAIQLSQPESGMVRLIYLTFDAKHPTSEKAMEAILDRMAKDGNQ